MQKKKRGADKVLELARRMARQEREDWVKAMAAETEQIPDNGAALRFALGCAFGVLADRTSTSTIGHAPRIFISLCLVFWAVAKFYVAAKLLDPAMAHRFGLATIFLLAGMCYAATSYLLLRRNMLSAGVMFFAALAINTLMLTITQVQTYFADAPIADALWRYGVVSEEYFIWLALAASVITARLWTALHDANEVTHA